MTAPADLPAHFQVDAAPSTEEGAAIQKSQANCNALAAKLTKADNKHLTPQFVNIDCANLIEIAAKLTKAQRDALIKAELDGNLGRYFSRFISVPAGRGLVKAGLGTAVWSGVMLSERGVALKQHLLAGEGGR